MRDALRRRPRSTTAALFTLAALGLGLSAPAPAFAGKLSWLDEVVQQVVREADAGGKTVARVGGDGAATALRRPARLFVREADESLEAVARRSDDLARAGRGTEAVSEAVLQRRFARLLPDDPQAARTFATLAPAEKRLVVEMGETARRLAVRYPGEAEGMIRALGTDGLSAVRVFGDDVAEVIVKEGPDSVNVLRKTGRGGWAFFTSQVLPHKKKLLAAGVFAAFVADPDRFVDYAGKATEYAVREFGRAGVALAGAVTGGATRGLEASVSEALGRYGLDFALARYVGMALAVLVAAVAGMVLLGFPVAWIFRPLARPFRYVFHRRDAAKVV